MKFVFIPQDETNPIHDVEYEGRLLTLFQGAVGGSVEMVTLPPFDAAGTQAFLYINENGKFLPGFDANVRATKLAKPNLMQGDYIAGPALVVGLDGDRDTDSPLDAETVVAILEDIDNPGVND